MKKLIALILALALTVSFVTFASAAASDGEKITIEMWLTGIDTSHDTRAAYIDKLSKQYSAAHENVEFKITYIGADANEYNRAWAIAAQNKNFPDLLFTFASNINEWSKAGLIVDLTDQFANDEEYKSHLIPGALEAYNTLGGGKIYGVPAWPETQGWIYNTEIFDKCGLAIPETWDELVNCIKVLKENGITPILHGGTDNWAIWGYHAFFTRYNWTQADAEAIMAGEKKFADCEGIVKGFEKIEELQKLGAFNEDAYTTSHMDAWSRFQAGQGAMYTVYSNISINADEATGKRTVFNFGPEFSDGVLGKRSGLRVHGWGMVMGQKATESEAKFQTCVEFMKYLASEDGAKAMAEWGLSNVTTYEVATAEVTPFRASILESFKADIIPTPDSFTYWLDQAYVDSYYNAVTGVILGQISAQEAIALLDQTADALR